MKIAPTFSFPTLLILLTTATIHEESDSTLLNWKRKSTCRVLKVVLTIFQVDVPGRKDSRLPEDGLTSTISGFRRPSAPRCSVRGAARFARRTTVHSHHEQKSKSARTPLLDTGRTARNLRHMGWQVSGRTLAVESSSSPSSPIFAHRAFYL